MREIATYEPTRYELTLMCPQGKQYLLAYTHHKGQVDLRSAIAERSQAILTKISGSPDAQIWITWGRRKAMFDGGWVASWTGRTQRTAYAEGELEFIGFKNKAQVA